MGLFEHFPYTNFQNLNLDELSNRVTALENLYKTMADQTPEILNRIRTLEDFQRELEAGDLSEGMRQAIFAWCQANYDEVFSRYIKLVYFGLTDDGHFCAFIPETWEEIEFKTSGYDIVLPDVPYGHLILDSTVSEIYYGGE